MEKVRLSIKSRGVFGSLIFMWWVSPLKRKIDLKRSERQLLSLKTTRIISNLKRALSRQPEIFQLNVAPSPGEFIMLF
jgi:hypothetical protein